MKEVLSVKKAKCSHIKYPVFKTLQKIKELQLSEVSLINKKETTAISTSSEKALVVIIPR